MKNCNDCLIRRSWLAVFALFVLSLSAYGAPKREFYELKVYHFKTGEQEKRIDQYLQTAYLPALHRSGIAKVGVFKPVANDTASDKKIYLLVPFRSMDDFAKLPQTLEKDNQYLTAGQTYLNAPHNDPPYTRIESMLMQAFADMPQMAVPALRAPVTERIYELRSYEGPTEKLYRNKVHMFNEGKEIGIFQRLGFNAVFYAEVLSGSHLPNLMYMTTFDSQASRDAHWKAFGDDAEWKKLVSMDFYQHNVSHADIFFLRPTSYSDI